MIVVSLHQCRPHLARLCGPLSILKFIERNWDLAPVTHRSRDNFPNPITSQLNPYAPVNSPAIGDLFELFDFGN
jgi:phospholipase C